MSSWNKVDYGFLEETKDMAKKTISIVGNIAIAAWAVDLFGRK